MVVVIPSNRGDDLHNLVRKDDADLVLFVAGNQFMVMEELSCVSNTLAMPGFYPGINLYTYVGFAHNYA